MMLQQQFPEYDTVIVLFRRDLRVDDNPALVGAAATARVLIPVYIWATEEQGQFQPGLSSRWWFKQSLTHLQQQIYMLGSRLIIRQGNSTVEELLKLVAETKSTAVFFNNLYDPISLLQDHQMKHTLEGAGIRVRSFNADLLYEPWEVMDEDKQPFKDFEGFWDKVKNMPRQPDCPLPCPATLPPVDPDLSSYALKEVKWFFQPEQEASMEPLAFQWQPGLHGAVEKLDAFLHTRLQMFEHDRAKVDRESTSQLSPWIHSGTISVRYIYYKVRQKQLEWARRGRDHSKSCEDFLQQMGYREYSRYICYHFPFALERPLLSHVRCVPWRMDIQHFKAWKAGKTGFPLIDAGMRMLWSSGWLHNRLRVVCASFLVKNLLLPWQWGLKHYWDALLDADLECDTLGWQYVAGCLRDAHPFSYMIDYGTESKRFDPDGRFVARWLPELARMPRKYIHEPWTASEVVRETANVELGVNYPHRIITEEESRFLVQRACDAIASGTVQDGDEYGPCRLATLERVPEELETDLSSGLEGDGEVSQPVSHVQESGCEFEPDEDEEDGDEDEEEDELMESGMSEDEVESGTMSRRQVVGCCSTNAPAGVHPHKKQMLRRAPPSPTAASTVNGNPNPQPPLSHTSPADHLTPTPIRPCNSEKARPSLSQPHTSSSQPHVPVSELHTSMSQPHTSLSQPHVAVPQDPTTGGPDRAIQVYRPPISFPYLLQDPMQYKLNSGSDRSAQTNPNALLTNMSNRADGSNTATGHQADCACASALPVKQEVIGCLADDAYRTQGSTGVPQQYEETAGGSRNHAQCGVKEQQWVHVPAKRPLSPRHEVHRESAAWESVQSLSGLAPGGGANVPPQVQASKRQHMDSPDSSAHRDQKHQPMSP